MYFLYVAVRREEGAKLFLRGVEIQVADVNYSARTRMGERDRALLNCRVSQLRRTIEEFE